MNMMTILTTAARAALLLLLSAAISHAAIIYRVSLDTSPLVGHPAGLFSLNFQLNDGSGTSDGNNMAILSNFLFGGGSGSGAPILSGGASGSLGTSVTLTDSSFFNAFTQEFVAGSNLQFLLELTTNVVGGGTPDQFSFAILDSSGFEIPTLGPFNALLVIDLDGVPPTTQVFATDAATAPNGGGQPIALGAPAVAEVPEPGTGLLCLATIAIAGVFRQLHGMRAKASG